MAEEIRALLRSNPVRETPSTRDLHRAGNEHPGLKSRTPHL